MQFWNDCKDQNIDQYLFMGDYYGEFPAPNEVISTVRSIGNSYIINGNKETRLIQQMSSGQSMWKYEQFAPLYWNAENIDKKNYKFINKLPEIFTFSDHNIRFFMAHSPDRHFGHGITDQISGKNFAEPSGQYGEDHGEYLRYANDVIHSDKYFMDILADMPDGVYLFGHYHTQWYAYVEGKCLINPGSCGLPLDLNTAAPYIIVEAIGEKLSVTERRVSYHIRQAANLIKRSDYYDIAPFWNTLSIIEFERARMAIVPFLEFTEQFAIRRNDFNRPYSNEIWNEAIKAYRIEMRI